MKNRMREFRSSGSARDGDGDIPIYSAAFVAWARGDYPTALRLWRFQAQKGDAAAQIGLGDMCREGLGVLQDYAEAATWYLVSQGR